ncbi:hypothetical protein ElyMa_001228200 [Elysia marginata]|uniref:Uncharacterized protein n=1 Tax=Elysia marginata TaxID=1093978 RepID=A0AAV4IAQ4_9GAST|nr:hypothetical protein ElyMa_001228200 [Elysia marginata]
MVELLEYQYIQDFELPEPDPWSEPLPIPILGYLLNSTPPSTTLSIATSATHGHSHHIHSQHCHDFHHWRGKYSGINNGHDHFHQHSPFSASSITSSNFNNFSTTSSELTVANSNRPISAMASKTSLSSNSIAPLGKNDKLKSISDTKLHRLSPDSKSHQNHRQHFRHGFASHFANFPEVLKSRLSSKRPLGKNSVDDAMHKDYLPLSMDTPRDSEDDYNNEDDVGDSRDLLDEKDLRKSTSCNIQ